VQLADRAVKLDPENADAQVIYSKIMLDQRQVNTAARAAREAIRLAPDKPEAMFQMAKVAQDARRYDEAEDWYRKAIDRLAHKQRKSNVYFHLAEMLSAREPVDIPKTAAAYESAADLTDDSIPILNDAAVFLMNNTERYDRAIGFVNKARNVADYSLGRQNLGLLQYFKWGHATMHPEQYRNAKDKPWEPERITAETGS
jgi:tetratricopeptide (TPR) repeat protein